MQKNVKYGIAIAMGVILIALVPAQAHLDPPKNPKLLVKVTY